MDYPTSWWLTSPTAVDPVSARVGANEQLVGDQGESALMLAASGGHEELVLLLLERGADAELSDEVSAHTSTIVLLRSTVRVLLQAKSVLYFYIMFASVFSMVQ